MRGKEQKVLDHEIEQVSREISELVNFLDSLEGELLSSEGMLLSKVQHLKYQHRKNSQKLTRLIKKREKLQQIDLPIR